MGNATKTAIRVMAHFVAMTDAAFNKRTKQYIDNGAKQVMEFQQWVANAFARYMETGDISHLNNMVAGSLAIQRYRAFMRVAKPLSCHEYKADDKIFVGKIDKAKREELCVTGDDGLELWESKLIEYFDKEDEHQEKAPAKSWDLDAEILKLITKAKKNSVGGVELAEKFVNAIKKQSVSAAA